MRILARKWVCADGFWCKRGGIQKAQNLKSGTQKARIQKRQNLKMWIWILASFWFSLPYRASQNLIYKSNICNYFINIHFFAGFIHKFII